MFTLEAIRALEILDSRGYPTLSVEVRFQTGATGEAKVPSGASTGSREALEKRDGGSRYGGKGVQQAVALIAGRLSQSLCGRTFSGMVELDAYLCELDGTPNKANLGSNVTLGISLAAARAQAQSFSLPLHATLGTAQNCPRVFPVPMLNVINGGAHADNALDIQECLIVPAGAPSFAESMRFGAEIFYALKRDLQQKGWSTGVGDEGGFSPNMGSTAQALECIMKAISITGLAPGQDVYLALDVASTELYQDGIYHLRGEKQHFSREKWIEKLQEWVNAYPILSLEDPLAENDWEGFSALTHKIGKRVQIIGDDLYTTQCASLQKGIDAGAGNAILIKPNQVGTLTETLRTIERAQSAGWGVIVSHRSGETEDTFIADLAFGCGAGQIKTGSLSRSERLAKYNRLLELEAAYPQVPFAGKRVYAQYLERTGQVCGSGILQD